MQSLHLETPSINQVSQPFQTDRKFYTDLHLADCRATLHDITLRMRNERQTTLPCAKTLLSLKTWRKTFITHVNQIQSGKDLNAAYLYSIDLHVSAYRKLYPEDIPQAEIN